MIGLIIVFGLFDLPQFTTLTVNKSFTKTSFIYLSSIFIFSFLPDVPFTNGNVTACEKSFQSITKDSIVTDQGICISIFKNIVSEHFKYAILSAINKD